MTGITFGEYQAQASRTLARKHLSEYSIEALRLKLAVMGLGVAGEAGEVADLIKKHVGHEHPLDRAKLAKELGDVLWYLAAIATLQGFTLEEIAEQNIAKLRVRYPDGFTAEDSLARRDGES